MRIVAGSLRGRRLETPKGGGIRPTADRVREALFSIIADRLDQATVLDLFAGTGALGLEALSRGASQAIFVDQSQEAIRLVRSNIARCGVQDRTDVIHASAEAALRQLSKRGMSFQLIFLDPPYAKGILERILPQLVPVAAGGAMVIAEHGAKELPPEQSGPWQRTRERRYGDTTISFYERELPLTGGLTR
ncbi:MAG: 16S rRNA (guanine(966)-N(2))-methyltransferase RsmD [Syntrophobacteraceae bacterium]